MSETKWTPGPWFATNVDYPDGSPMSGDEEGTWTVSPDPSIAGWCHDGGYSGYGVSEANARLMAAAPELYEALAAMIVEVRESHDKGDGHFSTEEIENAERALAKARSDAMTDEEALRALNESRGRIRNKRKAAGYDLAIAVLGAVVERDKAWRNFMQSIEGYFDIEAGFIDKHFVAPDRQPEPAAERRDDG